MISFVVSIAIAYMIAPVLPVSFGWENHIIENVQFAALLLGAGFPITEIFVFAARMMMAAAAEDHGVIDFSYLSAGSNQIA